MTPTQVRKPQREDFVHTVSEIFTDIDQKSPVWISQQADAKQRMREGGGAPDLARMEQIAGRSGREIVDAMMSGELPYPPMNETMNMTLLEVDDGRAVFQGSPLLQHCNPLGTVHGG